MLRRNVLSLFLPSLALLLIACSSDNFAGKNVAEGFKGDIDWVRDAFGQPVAKVVGDSPQGPFPSIPDDPRPTIRSGRQRTELINALTADQKNADRIELALTKADHTQYLTLDGAPPSAPSLQLAAEPVVLPDGVRDLDSYDPHRDNSWFALSSVAFAEGSSALPEQAAPALLKAAQLVAKEGSLRVVGYSASSRLQMDGKGPHEANRFLADLRARRVAVQLVGYGAPPRQLLVGAAPEDSRASGDKVEIIIDY